VEFSKPLPTHPPLTRHGLGPQAKETKDRRWNGKVFSFALGINLRCFSKGGSRVPSPRPFPCSMFFGFTVNCGQMANAFSVNKPFIVFQVTSV